MSPTRNSATLVNDQLAQDIARLEEEVKRQEDSGQFNTASHEVLANLRRAASGQQPAAQPDTENKE